MANRPLPENLIWIDLETTGSDEEQGDTVLDIGMIWTGKDLVERDATTILVLPKPFPPMNDYVTEMHTKNGLLTDVYAFGHPLATADLLASEWVAARCGTEHALMCGSGILHFDKRFIRKWLPLLHKRLTYYGVDVGALRRALELAGVEIDTGGAGDSDTKNHRGVDDARLHLAEMVAYRQALRGAFNLEELII